MMNQVNQTLSEDKECYVPKYLWAPQGSSIREQLLERSKEYRQKWLDKFTDREKQLLLHSWDFFARPKQLPPPNDFVDHPLGWKYWCILAGRGMGKTRLASEQIKYRVENKISKHILLAAPTYKDIEETMIEGESGIMEVFRNSKIKAKYIAKKGIRFYEGKKLIAKAQIRTGEEPERFRGVQSDFAWFDELAAFNYLEEVWLLFVAGHRLGDKPQAIFTTTPKSTLLKINLLNDPQTVVTFGTTRENKANLAEGFVESMENTYENSDFAEQELNGKLYLEADACLFRQSWINKFRLKAKVIKENNSFYIQTANSKLQLLKIVIAVDPSGSSKDLACECGISVTGIGSDNNAYVLEDLSKKCSPAEWTKISVQAAAKWNARIVYESNYGGEMPRALFKAAATELGVKVQVVDVRAVKNKVERAIPVSALTQRGRVFFVGIFTDLEKQMCTWEIGDKSPDRMDAYVWAITNLLIQAPVRNQNNIVLL